jgi:hypothetical protein
MKLVDETAQHGLVALYLEEDEVVRAIQCSMESSPNNFLWIYAVSLSSRINKQCQAPSPVPDLKSSMSIDLEGKKKNVNGELKF